MCHPASLKLHSSVNLEVLTIDAELRVAVVPSGGINLARRAAENEWSWGSSDTAKNRSDIQLPHCTQTQPEYVRLVRFWLYLADQLVLSEAEGMFQQRVNRVFEII